jgi:hypothetical protein
MDARRGEWVIRDGPKFIRTGAQGWKKAERMLDVYVATRPRTLVIPKKGGGFVYFVSVADFASDYPIKIGFTEKAGTVRLESIQTGCPYPLVMLATFAGTYQDESGLHRQFKADRLCGEWFKRSPDLMALIEQNRAKEAA